MKAEESQEFGSLGNSHSGGHGFESRQFHENESKPLRTVALRFCGRFDTT